MRALSLVVLMCFAVNARSQGFTPEEVCHWRADILGSIAQERDKGVSKAEVLRVFLSRLKVKRSQVEPWVEMAYSKDARAYSPKDLSALILNGCLANLPK